MLQLITHQSLVMDWRFVSEGFGFGLVKRMAQENRTGCRISSLDSTRLPREREPVLAGFD